jgi:hypothetical protein
MADRDSILSKLEALMKRTRENGASEAEVESAMAVARKLMDQHNIAMEEILLKEQQGGAQTIDVVEQDVRTSAKKDRFEHYLMHAASDICDVKWYWKTFKLGGGRKQITLVFYGMKHDVLAAKLLFLELLVTVRAMARVKVGKGWTQRHYYYCDGFTAGLMQKAAQLKAQSQQAATSSTALILCKDQAIAKYADEVLKAKTAKTRGIDKSRLSSEEFQEGYRDGCDYDLNPKREKQVEQRTKNLN